MGQEFFILHGQKGLLKSQKERIQELFDVTIALASDCLHTNDAGSWRPTLAEGAGRTKVEITGPDHGLCTGARDYIASLSQKEQIYPEDILDRIEGRLHSLKVASGAHIARPKPDTLVFVGSQEQILKALSLIEETSNIVSMHDLATKINSHTAVPSPGSGDDTHFHRLPAAVSECETQPLPQARYPKLREDDYMRTTLLGGTGCSRPGTTGLNPCLQQSRDEQRTVGVSDTHAVVDKSDSAPDPSGEHSVIYRHMVTLGYKCEQIKAALGKFGPKATMDTVLDHLLNQVDSSDPRISSQEPDDREIAEALAAHEEEIDENHSSNLRPIYIDGSNVAMSKGRNSQFDCHGIKFAVDFFLKRGHTKVIAFVPNFRKEKNKAEPTIGQEILTELEGQENLVFTPSRRIGTKRIVSYDDRFILDAAVQMEGIVVSNDHFRDLLMEDAKYKKVIEEQLLMYTFVHDMFMPSQDPLGKHGPSLDDFLKKRTQKQKQLQRCPYGVKCTFGAQCKYYHPERRAGARTVTQKLRDIAQEKLQDRSDNGKCFTAPLPGHSNPSNRPHEASKSRSMADHVSTTSPLPGHVPSMGAGGHHGAPHPYPHHRLQHPGFGGMPRNQPQESEQEMMREFEQWKLEKRLKSVPQPQHNSTPSRQSSPINSGQLLGYSHSGYKIPQPPATANQQQQHYSAPSSRTPPMGSDQLLGYSHPGYQVPQPSAMANSPRGSPYSSPTNTGLLNIQESPYSSNPLRASPMDPSLLQGSHQSLRPGTAPFLPQFQGYATSSGSVLPGGSYHHQHHHAPSNPAGAVGSGGRVFSAGSDPLGYPCPQQVQRSTSLQEGDSLQRTRQNIFNNLSRSYGSDLVRYVMSSYPQETDVGKIVFLLNKLTPEFKAGRSDLHRS